MCLLGYDQVPDSHIAFVCMADYSYLTSVFKLNALLWSTCSVASQQMVFVHIRAAVNAPWILILHSEDYSDVVM